ncbi:MAG: cobyrinate a,c-diamide synthase [Nitrospira sp.]|nr:MAG: cobyrinate a,c-diamide synthase [Nitrospira sp.]
MGTNRRGADRPSMGHGNRRTLAGEPRRAGALPSVRRDSSRRENSRVGNCAHASWRSGGVAKRRDLRNHHGSNSVSPSTHGFSRGGQLGGGWRDASSAATKSPRRPLCLGCLEWFCAGRLGGHPVRYRFHLHAVADTAALWICLFNRISSEGHYTLLKEAVEQETDVMVVGYLRPNPAVTISDRHLGLVMAMEQGTGELYDVLAKAAAETVDLDRVEALARSCSELPVAAPQSVVRNHVRTVRIGVAQDQAFCFYYPDNLELLEAEGAELVKLSPLNDQVLPDVDMLYLGGGYPELHGERLAHNVTMRAAIRKFAERGGAIYAECGGMMYLTQAIRDFDGTSHEMVGLFAAEAIMRRPGLSLGYRTLELTASCILGEPGDIARGHEFHYSTLEPKGPLRYACTLTDAQGKPKGQDGLVMGNTLALYTHLHFASQPQVAHALVAFARRTTAQSSVSPGEVR